MRLPGRPVMVKTLMPPDPDPPLSLGRGDCIVHCSYLGCRWAAVARDDIEAAIKLEVHLEIRHTPQES